MVASTHRKGGISVLAAILHFACSILEDAALSQNLHDVLVGEI